jgi:MFS family permease
MAGSVQRYFAGLSRNTFLLAAASLFADISTEMLYPVLPVFLTQNLKASGSIVGLVDGFAQAAQNIVQGFSGALSDKLQRRKPVAVFGYLLAAIAKPLMGLATVFVGCHAITRHSSLACPKFLEERKPVEKPFQCRLLKR